MPSRIMILSRYPSRMCEAECEEAQSKFSLRLPQSFQNSQNQDKQNSPRVAPTDRHYPMTNRNCAGHTKARSPTASETIRSSAATTLRERHYNFAITPIILLKPNQNIGGTPKQPKHFFLKKIRKFLVSPLVAQYPRRHSFVAEQFANSHELLQPAATREHDPLATGTLGSHPPPILPRLTLESAITRRFGRGCPISSTIILMEVIVQAGMLRLLLLQSRRLQLHLHLQLLMSVRSAAHCMIPPKEEEKARP